MEDVVRSAFVLVSDFHLITQVFFVSADADLAHAWTL